MLLLHVGLKLCVESEDNSVCVCFSLVHVYMWVYLCMFESVLHCVGVLAAKTVCVRVYVCTVCMCVCVC